MALIKLVAAQEKARIEGVPPTGTTAAAGGSATDALQDMLADVAAEPATAVQAPVSSSQEEVPKPAVNAEAAPSGGFLKRAQSNNERTREVHRAALDYLSILKSLAPVFKAATIYPGHDAAPEQVGAAVRLMSQVSVDLAGYIATHGDQLELDGAWARKTLHDFTAELVSTHWITTVIGKGGALPGHSPNISADYFIPAIKAVMELPTDRPARSDKLNLSMNGALQLSMLKAMTPLAIEIEKYAAIITARIPSATVSAEGLIAEASQFILEQASVHHEKFASDNPDVTEDDRRAMLQSLIAHAASVMLSAWEYCRGQILGAIKDASTEGQAAAIISQAGSHGFPMEGMKTRARESLRRLCGASQYALSMMRQAGDPANAKGA